MPTTVQFTPFSSLVQSSFWHELNRLKLDVLKLSDESVPIRAEYGVGRTFFDRETQQEVGLGCQLTVGEDAFKGESSSKQVVVEGVFKNFNTTEEFKAADKTALFNQVADEMWRATRESRDLSKLTRFLLISFADLKKYKYCYWFAFPAFVAKPAWTIGDEGWQNAEEAIGAESLKSLQPHVKSNAFFLARRTSANAFEFGLVSSYPEFFASTPAKDQIIGFTDPSTNPQSPGWPLRNLLAYLHSITTQTPTTPSEFRVLCWRDAEPPSQGKPWRSRFGVVKGGVEFTPETRPAAIGWEKSPPLGKLQPRWADLAPMMDPKKLADQAVDLNLKLMRWRVLPTLDLDKIATTRCLLLGAGTLGCYVARALMGWGVRTITFVDYGKVSFSNPVRQPLFTFEDCLGGGQPKAECAAKRLTEVFPGVESTGHTLSIPMPGHPIPPASVEQTRADVKRLEKLIDEHDAVFLLMDSRESRWLPTVMGSAKNKIVLNVALGFDTYVVMRHGARKPFPPSESAPSSEAYTIDRLGCYFCNDIVAPADSITDRTLDQMCTVTRPGLAPTAAGAAVELLASITQHPDGVSVRAPPLTKDQADNYVTTGEPGVPGGHTTPLGLVPHTLRGYLAQFRTLPIVGAAYSKCTGCSDAIIEAYEQGGFVTLLKAFNEPGYLESVTGLDKLHDEGEKALESVDWDEEGSGEGDDF